MPPRTSARAASAKAATPKPAAEPKAKAAASKPAAKATATKKAAPKATTTKPKAAAKPAAETKKPAAKKAKTEKAAPKPAKTVKSATANGTATKADAKPVTGTKRGRTPDAAEAPKKVVVKRRRTGQQINEFPVPNPQGASVFVWGTGDMGQFGLGPDDLDEKKRPQIHSWFEEQKEEKKLGSGADGGGVEAITAGGMHTLAIDEAGQLRSWGINDNAALGRITANRTDDKGEAIDAEEFETYPLVVEALKEEEFRPVKIAAGDSVSVAIDNKGGLRAWGSFRSNEGILGFDENTKFQFHPTELPALAPVEVVDIACGTDHVMALTSDGFVYTWGNGQQYQLGRRVLERRIMQGLDPQRLGLRNIVHIAAGAYHSFAVDKNGKVYAWGLNTMKQLGLSGREAEEEMVQHPVLVSSLSPSEHNGAKVVQISAGGLCSFFLFDNGQVYGVGRCDGNELGLGPDHPEQEHLKERREEMQAEKAQIVKDRESKLEEVKASGADEEAVQAAEMSLLEAKASLNTPTAEYVPEPVLIPFPPIPESYEKVPEMGAYSEEVINPIAQVSAGTRHILAVSKSGHLYAWGYGNQSQLGLGDEEQVEVPTLVRSKQLRPYDSISASAGGQHCVLIAKKRAE